MPYPSEIFSADESRRPDTYVIAVDVSIKSAYVGFQHI